MLPFPSGIQLAAIFCVISPLARQLSHCTVLLALCVCVCVCVYFHCLKIPLSALAYCNTLLVQLSWVSRNFVGGGERSNKIWHIGLDQTSQKWIMLQRGYFEEGEEISIVCLPKTIKIFAKKSFLSQLITSSPSLMPTISSMCAFSYIAIWMRKLHDK